MTALSPSINDRPLSSRSTESPTTTMSPSPHQISSSVNYEKITLPAARGRHRSTSTPDDSMELSIQQTDAGDMTKPILKFGMAAILSADFSSRSTNTHSE